MELLHSELYPPNANVKYRTQAGNVAYMVRIFVADDHEVVRSGLRSVIARQDNWSVCGEAADGLEAVSMCMALKPDLVVLDISMPIMSGLQACAKLRELVPNAKIILLTMHDPANMPAILSSAGAHACLSKTESNEKLMQAMVSALHGGPAQRQQPPTLPQSEPPAA